MRRIATVFLAGVMAVSLAACENAGQKQVGGTVVGGALGGLLGAQVGSGTGQLAATAAGALLGALAGSEVGKSLDRADRMYAARTTQSALETNKSGTASSWTNPDSGHSGAVTPVRTYQTAQGEYCREFQQTVTIDGKSESAYGTACRQPDGSWKIVSK
jgi:surface antigen